MGARTRLPRPDALSSVLEGHLSQPTNKRPEESAFKRSGKLLMTRDIKSLRGKGDVGTLNEGV